MSDNCLFCNCNVFETFVAGYGLGTKVKTAEDFKVMMEGYCCPHCAGRMAVTFEKVAEALERGGGTATVN